MHERRLAVGVEPVGRRVAVGPGPSRHHVRLAALAQSGEALAAARDPHAGRHERPADAGAAALVEAEEAAAPGLGPERVVGRLRRHVGVEALVEPRLLELVVRHEPVPELVPGLVDRDALGALQLLGREPGGAAGEERRVLHPARGRVERRVHHGDLRVGIGRRPGAVGPQRDLRGVQVALAERWRARAAAAAGCRRADSPAPRSARAARGSGGSPSRRSRGRPPGRSGRSRCHRGCRSSTPAGPSLPRRSRSAASASRRRRRSRRRTRSTGRTDGSSTGPSRTRRSSGTTGRRSCSRGPSRRGPPCRAGRATATRCGSARSPPARSGVRCAPPSRCGRRCCRPRSGSAASASRSSSGSPSSRMLLTSIQPKLRSSRFASSGARRPSPRAVVERLLRNAFQ